MTAMEKKHHILNGKTCGISTLHQRENHEHMPFLGENQGKSNLLFGKTSEVHVFDGTIMGNPNCSSQHQGTFQFLMGKTLNSLRVRSPIFGGFCCDQDPDSSNAAWYYANFSNYFIAAGTESCGQTGNPKEHVGM